MKHRRNGIDNDERRKSKGHAAKAKGTDRQNQKDMKQTNYQKGVGRDKIQKGPEQTKYQKKVGTAKMKAGCGKAAYQQSKCKRTEI